MMGTNDGGRRRCLAWAALAMALSVVPSAALRAVADPPPVTVLVAYYSQSGNTEKMAQAVADGARLIPQTTVVLKKVADVSADDLKKADGMVLGSPTYWGNMAGPVKMFIDDWFLKYKVALTDKVGGAFASGGAETGGKEHVIASLNLAMVNGGMVLVGPVRDGLGAAGVSAVSPVNDEALKECRALGERVATIARRLRVDAAGTSR